MTNEEKTVILDKAKRSFAFASAFFAVLDKILDTTEEELRTWDESEDITFKHLFLTIVENIREQQHELVRVGAKAVKLMAENAPEELEEKE